MAAVVRFLTAIVIAIAVAIAMGFGLFVFGTIVREAVPGESRIRVAVLDTGLDLSDPRFKNVLCEGGHRDFTGTSITDVHGHGTHVAGIIASRTKAKNYCLVILKYYLEQATGQQNLAREVKALQWATRQGVRVVNFSGGGPEFAEEEFDVIQRHPEVMFSVAAGNEGKDITLAPNFYYPASYALRNVHATVNIDCTGRKPVLGPKSNYARGLDGRCGTNILSTLPNGKVGYMSGTSQATAVYTAELLNGMNGANQ